MDRRTERRYSCSHETFCQQVTTKMGDLWWQATIADVSVTGLRLHCTRRFESATFLSLELPSGNMVVRVVYSRPCEEGGWSIGCCFLNELSDNELQSVLTENNIDISGGVAVPAPAPYFGSLAATTA